jgi:hypothetical protein
LHDAVGDHAHQADVPAAVDQGDVLADQRGAEHLGSSTKSRVGARAGTAEDAQTSITCNR